MDTIDIREPNDRSRPSIHDFAFDTAFRVAGMPFGIRPDTCRVTVDDDDFTAEFGPCTVATPIGNVEGAAVTGPYALVSAIGPPHVAMGDQGLTFATNHTLGTCVSFHAPVTGLLPFGLTTHPSLTVTVADPTGLAELMNAIATQPREESAPTTAAVISLHDRRVGSRRP